MQHSAVLIIPATMKQAADTLGEAMGWGEVSYTIPLGDGQNVTHFAARADVGIQFVRWIRGIDPLPEASAQAVIASLHADFSPDPTFEGDVPPPLLWGNEHLDHVLHDMALEIMPR